MSLAPSLGTQVKGHSTPKGKWPCYLSTSCLIFSYTYRTNLWRVASYLFLNPSLAALLKGNMYPFPRCVPFSAPLQISPHLQPITIQFSRFFYLLLASLFSDHSSVFCWILSLHYCSPWFNPVIFSTYILFHGNFIHPNSVKFLPLHKYFPNLSNSDLSHKPQTFFK